MARSGRLDNSADQMSMFNVPIIHEVDAKRKPDGELVHSRKPTQTTPKDREEIRRHITVTSATPVEGRWDLKEK